MNEDNLRAKHYIEQLDKISKIENMLHRPFYDLQQQQKLEINIRVDNSVDHGLFRPDPKKPEGWITSEQTFRAMKKDIFALGDNIDELVQPYQCDSCHSDLDKQFWYFCPYCGANFPQ